MRTDWVLEAEQTTAVDIGRVDTTVTFYMSANQIIVLLHD